LTVSAASPTPLDAQAFGEIAAEQMLAEIVGHIQKNFHFVFQWNATIV